MTGSSYSNLKEVIDGEWKEPSASGFATKGIIEYYDTMRYWEVQYGVILKQVAFGFGALGFSRQIADDMMGDVFAVYCMGRTDEEVRDLIKELHRIAITWIGDNELSASSRDEYHQLHMEEKIKYEPEEPHALRNTWRYAIVGILATRTGESLLTPV